MFFSLQYRWFDLIYDNIDEKNDTEVGFFCVINSFNKCFCGVALESWVINDDVIWLLSR